MTVIIQPIEVKVIKMFLLSCKDMRRLVLLSGVLFSLGIAMQLIMNITMPSSPYLPSFVPYLGFFFILVSPILLLSTVVISLLPGDAEKMQSCKH
ncbi:MAG: hypothetical protein ABFS39_11905 [Pseudomonadota bacterium]